MFSLDSIIKNNYINQEVLFKKKAKLVRTEIIFPIYRKSKKTSRKKFGNIANIALKLLTNNLNIITRYPKYVGCLPVKKKTAIKRKEGVRILFYKTTIRNENMFCFLKLWLNNIVYVKNMYKNSSLLFKHKESIFYIKNKKYYKPKIKEKKINTQKNKITMNIYSFKFPTKIIDFSFLNKFESITNILLDFQTNIVINSFEKKEAIFLLKKMNIL